MIMEWVVKIGGSLFPEDAVKLCQALIGRDVLVVCGGGDLANLLRDYDKRMNFSSTATHQAAILCMDLLGMLLSDKVKGAEAFYSVESAQKAFKKGIIPVLLPSQFLLPLEGVDHSWKVTSDSLSLYISHHLKAKLLIATDVDGVYTQEPSHADAKLIKNINAKKLLNFGKTSVDEILGELLLQYKSNCYVVNGKHPERVISIMEGKDNKYTFIGGY
jgi:5-(aminomethyl)-3-furanmethanol phosphate kinase